MKFIYPKKEIVFVGENALSYRKEFELEYYEAIISGTETFSDLPLLKDRFKEGKTLMYLCENGECRLPVEKIEELKYGYS